MRTPLVVFSMVWCGASIAYAQNVGAGGATNAAISDTDQRQLHYAAWTLGMDLLVAAETFPDDPPTRRVLRARAYERFRAATSAFRLEDHPNDPRVYERNYQLARCLEAFPSPERAAREFERVRDSHAGTALRRFAAEHAVNAWIEALDSQVRRGAIRLRGQPRLDPSDDGLARAPMPEVLSALVAAIEVILAMPDHAQESEETLIERRAYVGWAYYTYGDFVKARPYLEQVYAAACNGPHASGLGARAVWELEAIASLENRRDVAEGYARVLNGHTCSFRATRLTVRPVAPGQEWLDGTLAPYIAVIDDSEWTATLDVRCTGSGTEYTGSGQDHTPFRLEAHGPQVNATGDDHLVCEISEVHHTGCVPWVPVTTVAVTVPFPAITPAPPTSPTPNGGQR